MKQQLAINSGKYLLGPKTPFHLKMCISWRLSKYFGVLTENIVPCQKTFFLCLLYIYIFPHCKFSLFFFQLIELGSKLGLQRAQFRNWVPNQIIWVWFILYNFFLIWFFLLLKGGFTLSIGVRKKMISDKGGRVG